VRIVHRDIKLDNFLYGGHLQRTVKLADFGLAAKMPRKGYMKGVSGTAPYMSPEMLTNVGYDTQTDNWSFAATTYIILFGDCPYSPKEATAAAVKKAIIQASPEPIWARPEKIAKHYSQPPQRATEFCRYLLKRNPAERPSAKQGLQHGFLNIQWGSTKRAEEPLLDMPILQMRSFANQFKKLRHDPTIQRNLDEVLARLAAAGPSIPNRMDGDATEDANHSQRHCFTEAPPVVKASMAASIVGN
ncbi:unnamed protein product, partial [Polarella glacialis]